MIFAVSAVLAACGPIIRVQQPVVIGQPGTVYEPTDADISVDVVNNSSVTGDVLIGKTVILKDVKPGEIENVGFNCSGFVIFGNRRIRSNGSSNRREYIYFRPQDGRYLTLSKSVSVNCGSRHQQKSQFRITSLRRVR